MRRTNEDGQGNLDFARRESIIYTNIAPDTAPGKALMAAEHEDMLGTRTLIGLYYDRGHDELVHRALKDFFTEELPCKRFEAKAALYFIRLIAIFLIEMFKEDYCPGVIELTSYATRLRRRAIDVTATIVRTGRRTIMKVTGYAYRALKLDVLWELAGEPPRIVCG
ncbi:MAG: hypothetical protein RLO04_11150 [Limnobacter sp.]|uniref:hypothetical protein n=1 Tax=Limnobacter sp. TaxID=2003368 RepID=UPI0032EC42B9